MGSINKFRPLNGRNNTGPSFLVCALFIGLCIVTVSYYNLSQQYTKLYINFADSIKQKKLLETELELKKTERINDLVEEKKSQEAIKEFKSLLEVKNKRIDEINNLFNKLKEDTDKKEKDLKNLKTKLNDNQVTINNQSEKIKNSDYIINRFKEENEKLKEQINEQKEKLFPKEEKKLDSLDDGKLEKSNLDPKSKIIDNTNLIEKKENDDKINKELKEKQNLNDKNPKLKKEQKNSVINLLKSNN